MKFIINTDGGARGNPGPAGIGVMMVDDQSGKIFEYKQYIGSATNNVAEYKALLLALAEAQKIALSAGEKSLTVQLEVRMDSELIVKQMLGQYKIKEPTLQVLAQEVFLEIKKFSHVSFTHVRREFNKQADKLVNQAIDEHLKVAK